MPITSRIAAAAARGFGLFSAIAKVTDAYFKYVTLLLPGNGTNGAQNNTFLDSSNNNFTITRNGNTTQGTFAPYGVNWSNYFDGSGDYLVTPSSTAFSPGSGDWTFEGWFFATVKANRLVQFSDDNGNLTFNRDGVSNLGAYINGVDYSFGTTPTNSWVHFAISVTSGTCSGYLNGTRVFNFSGGSATSSARSFTIGSGTSGADPFTGYISNLRYVKGTGVYSGTTITVPTAPLTAITNTSLLTCQSNRFIDNSSNAFTITKNGDTSVQVFSPFSPTAAYSASTIGGSGYFDGSGDYLSVAYNSAFNFGTGDFTIECWVYPVGNQALYTGIATQNGSTTGWYLSFGTSNTVRFTDYGTAYLASSSSLNTNSWTHVAVSRSGTSMKMFFNGVVVASTTSSATFGEAFPVVIGFNAALYFLGYISDFRAVKGTAVYTAAFTPPTAPLTAITNTSLLLSSTNAGVIDNAMMNDLETVGNAQISTTQSKWGGSSIAFDGTGDRLTVPFTNDFLELGINGQNFTVEAWIYPTNTMASTGQILSKGGGTASWSTTSGAQYQWAISSSALSWSFNSSGAAITVNSGTVTLNTWQHVAVTYDGTTTRTFLNGVLQATSTSSYTAPTTRNLQYIGMTQSGGYTQEYYGYIDDFRITKGYARYTANFTAPTGPFPTR